MKILILFLFCSFAVFCTGQEHAVTKEALLKDIDAYRDGIIENDIDPFSAITKQEFLDEVAKIKADAEHRNIDELIVALRVLNGKLCDEHSRIGGFKEGRILPFICHSFEEGIYIILTDAANGKYLYSKVIAINHLPVAKVVQQIATTLPNKNEGTIKDQAPLLLSRKRILHGLRIIDNIDSVPVTLVSKDKDTINTVFLSQEGKDVTFVKNRHLHGTVAHSKKGNYWYHYDPAANYIYFNYSSCTEDPSYSFEKFTVDFFKEVVEKKPTKVIIDLRDNEGGHRATLKPFIHELNKSALNTSGHVFVLIGRKTFSAALNNVFDLARAIPITTIGESTSGSINHLGQVKSFKLPNGGLSVSYSTNHIINDPKASGPLKPDVAIPVTLSDYISDLDAALNYAVSH